jgi:LAO/AO transport system kinase
MRTRLTADDYISGILSGNRNILSRAITIVESTHPSDRILAPQILESILPFSGKALRIGISGIPGVGKSTFIETFGKHLTSIGKKVAVLAIDPSSSKSKGSILGDQTRMNKLSLDPKAYIRPSANNLTLGGVTAHTREAILLCEAAGYEIILIETVGVGQAEIQIREMTDFVLLLMLTDAGDELQSIKKGIIEIADLIAINKADGLNAFQVQEALRKYENVIHNSVPAPSGQKIHVMPISALTGKGLEQLWAVMEAYHTNTMQNGYFNLNRQNQNVQWIHLHIQKKLFRLLYENTEMDQLIHALAKEVKAGIRLPDQAAEKIISDFISSLSKLHRTL